MKIIDADKLFDNYISGYVYSNIGKVKPEEIENKIPELYIEFGKTKSKDFDGFAPQEYYGQFTTQELLDGLFSHLKDKVPVSDFLCESITAKKETDILLSALKEDKGEEFTVYILNFIKDIGENIDGKAFLPLLKSGTDTVKELATEILNENPNGVIDDIVNDYKTADKNLKEYYIEILSHADKKDEIFDILIGEFKENKNKTALYAGYIARYGDERALPYLQERVKEKIDYADFEELRFAIESLGGVCEETPDFSSDKTYEKIKGRKRRHIH